MPGSFRKNRQGGGYFWLPPVHIERWGSSFGVPSSPKSLKGVSGEAHRRTSEFRGQDGSNSRKGAIKRIMHAEKGARKKASFDRGGIKEGL